MRTIFEIETLCANGEEQQQQQRHSQKTYIHISKQFSMCMKYEHVEHPNTRKYSIVVAIAGYEFHLANLKCTYTFEIPSVK